MPHATNNLMRKAVPPQITRVHEGRSVYKELYPSENTINFCQAGILKKIPAFFFSYFKPVKIISLVLSFSILFTSLAPSYAEGVAAMQRRQEQALATGVERAVAQATLAQVTPQARAEQLVRKAYSTEIKLGIAGLIAKGCQNDLMQAGVKDGELAATKQVCNKAGVCVSADLYGQACAKIAIDAAWDGQAEVMNEVKKTAQGYEGVALDLSKLIVTVGAELIDSEKIYEYEEGVLKSKGVCEDSGWTRQISKAGRERVKEEAPMQSARCEAALTALEAVAVLGVMYPRKYQARAEETIYQFMQAKKRDAMGGVGVYKGVLLLMGLNSAHSYELLAKFLKESTPNIGGTTAEALGHAVSLEGWLSTAPAALRGRYLNIYTQRYSYRDMELAKQWGLACENLEEDTVQCPQGNIYEDIGEVIAMDLQNPRSKTLARQIFEDGQNYHIAGLYARPLWVGLLTGNISLYYRQRRMHLYCR
ncbi:MAG: hypothetical protein J6U96_05470 [Elusimicrobiaceae bacterium]|nr:hypothetical protein [Elusimicrobiaceae bacterium]